MTQESRMFVRPALDGLMIPMPDAPAAAMWLPPAGAEVPDDDYWRRRVAQGDVVVADPPAEPEPASPPADPAQQE
jgi:hypothetical protein